LGSTVQCGPVRVGECAVHRRPAARSWDPRWGRIHRSWRSAVVFACDRGSGAARDGAVLPERGGPRGPGVHHAAVTRYKARPHGAAENE